MPKIKLQSLDGDIFDVDTDIVRCSSTINVMLDSYGTGEDKEEIIPLSNVNSKTLEKIICWATHHKNDPPLTHEDIKRMRSSWKISEWDAEFLKCDQATLYDLILAANYLDIKGLLETCCKTVAEKMKGKSAEEIRNTLKIKNDFTPEEEARIRAENKWCEEK